MQRDLNVKNKIITINDSNSAILNFKLIYCKIYFSECVLAKGDSVSLSDFYSQGCKNLLSNESGT